MFVEESIAESTQWIVHEPNDQRLWGKIVRSVSAFLRRQWLEGALFGASEAEAYYVKCDEETNPLEVRQAYQVVTEIGVNIVDTAEFVIFRIAQWSGGRRISE
jgi:phage tail sheath protein FI